MKAVAYGENKRNENRQMAAINMKQWRNISVKNASK